MEKNEIKYENFTSMGELRDFIKTYPIVKERIINIETIKDSNTSYSIFGRTYEPALYRLWYWE